ncbi:TonB-dependent receptor domain-containing protein [Saccharicrinis aurantiacus]|uniref:TonB-dependent receptor domain-containing protein n=1 Tax=Saccharicrinis aurantiacus TaxID=1849719 RepID=UPI00249340D2|nr:TonB-dependent receptor [Saccharicrinis aurantiacus]
MKYLKLLILLAMPLISRAQNESSITGIVTNSKGETVPFANVALYTQEENALVGGVTTNIDGEFTIPNLASNTYSIMVSFLGYEPLTTNNIVVNGNVNLGALQLQDQLTELEEVEVKAQRPTIEQGLGKTTLNVGNDLSNANESALDLIQYVPSGSTDADGNVTLRGAPATILIDGVPTDLQNALETIPVDAIDKLEIINNPSAKYASQNGAGVINIVLKKDNLKGSNGRVTGMLGTPDRQQLSGNIMLQDNKLSSSTNVNYTHVYDEIDANSKRITISDTNPTFLNNTGTSEKNTSKITIRQKFKYQINKKSSARISGNYQKYDTDNNGYNRALNYKADSTLRSDNRNSTIANYEREYWSINARYNYDFSSNTSLIINAKHEGQNSLNQSDRTINFYEPDTGEEEKRYKTQDRFVPEYMNSTRLNIDFEHSFNKHLKIESGLFFVNKYANTDNQFLRTDYNWSEDDDDYIPDVDSSQFYIFETTERNATGYSVLSTQLGKWELAGGLRYEYITLEPYSPTNDSGAVNRNHNFLPSLQVRNVVSDNFDFGFSYSKRVKMPNYRQLNPMVVYNGLYNKSSGNPYLSPEQIHNIELSANLRIGNHRFMPSIFYKHHTDVITQYQELVEEDGEEILHRKFENIGDMEQTGFELNISNRFFEVWRLKTNFLSYYQGIDNFKDGEFERINDWVNNVKITSDITFLKTFKWQVTGTYESPRNTTVGQNYERMFVNTNIRKSFLDNQATLTFRVNDVFNTLDRGRENTSSPKFVSTSYTKGISRYMALAFSYRFNTMKRN